METIFQKIIAREIPATIVYEDETVLAFLDIRPSNKGHTLVVPKEPSVDLFAIDEETLAHLAHVAKRVAHAVRDGLGADGVNIIMNNGAAAGQEVPHAHVHVVPRFQGDDVFLPPKHTTYADGEADAVAAKIKSALGS